MEYFSEGEEWESKNLSAAFNGNPQIDEALGVVAQA